MQIERKGDTLLITVNVSEAAIKDARPSSTGKTLIVDTQSSKLGALSVACNVYVPNPAFTKPAKVKVAA